MKRLFTLLFICLTTIALQAQSTKELDGYPTIFSDYGSYYDKWISENEYFKTSSWLKKGWSIYYRFADNTYQKAYMYIPVGDSIVAGKAYARVLINQKTLLYRQEDDKVFIRTDGEDKLLIDYGLKEGDTFVSPQGEHFMVIATDTATYQGSSYGSYKYWRYQCIFFLGNTVPRILHLQSEDGTKEDEWVEGLGSAYWGILPPYLAECQDVYPKRPVKSHVITASSPCLIEEGEYISASYNLNEEDYKRISFEPQDIEYLEDHPWTFTFIGDTLHITGAMDLNCLPTYAECTIKGNDIDVLIYQVSNGLLEPDCMVERYVDIRFTGFKPGTYKIGISGEKRQEVVCTGKQDDYVPFVEKWKKWHVLGFSVGPYISKTDYFFQHEEVSIGEHTYMPLYSEDKTVYQGFDKEAKHLEGFFREEDRRVYRYDEETAQEYCVYDFTLEVGDTFNIDIEHEANLCVVTKVDYMNVKDKYLKTITFSSVNLYNESQMAHVNHTWVEGFGDTSNPTFGWIPNTNYLADPAWSSFNVAYMVCYNQPFICPLSIFGSCGGGISVIGQELVSGEGLSWEEYKEKYQGKPLLDYEIMGGQLHVKGYMWLASCSPYYIYCKLSPTEEPWTYKISLAEEVMGEEPDCISTPHAVDLYFDIPLLKEDTYNYDKYRFIYTDETGEHEVINHNEYHPFIEDGKVWKTGWVTLPQYPAHSIDYYYLEGDTVIKEQTYRKLMRTNVTKERKVTVYNGALREEGKKVYYSGGLLYDFGANIGDTLDVYPFLEGIKVIIDKKEEENIDDYSLKRTLLGVYGPREEGDLCIINHDAWYEGIGYMAGPCAGPNPGWPTGMYFNRLLSCTVWDETLYQSSTWTEDVSQHWPDIEVNPGGAEARKEKIDFTHVIKTRPTGPAYAPGIGLIWGEYDDAMLSIDFANMTGTYKITIHHKDEEQDRYADNSRTDILRTLDINLTGYPQGDYTVTVENTEEAYTAHFSLPLEGNGIHAVSDTQRTGHDVWFDLSGRCVAHSQLRKGIYIRDRKKKVIR